MTSPRNLVGMVVVALALGASPVRAFTLVLSDIDFTMSPVFSSVTNFSFDMDIAEPLRRTEYSDPAIANIQYSVNGSLDPSTPSGFPAFAFELQHIFPSSPPITGTEFYMLNPAAVAGATLRFEVSPTANLSDGLQISELDELPASFGSGVVFHFNGREEGTGRYHPTFLQLRSDGTGIIQNANNMGGDNPSDGFVGDINVDFGDEFITNLSFDPSTLTIGIPEPGLSALLFSAGLFLAGCRRRR